MNSEPLVLFQKWISEFIERNEVSIDARSFITTKVGRYISSKKFPVICLGMKMEMKRGISTALEYVESQMLKIYSGECSGYKIQESKENQKEVPFFILLFAA